MPHACRVTIGPITPLALPALTFPTTYHQLQNTVPLHGITVAAARHATTPGGLCYHSRVGVGVRDSAVY